MIAETSKPRWILAVTKPRAEKWAAENVRNQGHEFYLPMCSEMKVHKQRTAEIIKPLFPRYLFVHVTVRWRFLLSTFGVIGVVLDGDFPAIVPEYIIGDLKASEEEGIVALPEPPPPEAYKRGDKVTIDNPNFKDLVGLYNGSAGEDRAKILLDILGKETPIFVPHELLRKA